MSRTNELTAAIIRYMTLIGWRLVWRQNNHATPIRKGVKIVGMRKMPARSRMGVPDILAVQPGTGRLWGIEIKTGKDRLREEQKQFRDDLTASGGVYLVAGSVGDVMDVLNAEKKMGAK